VTRKQAQEIREAALAEGFRDLDLRVEPVGGWYWKNRGHGHAVRTTYTDNWYFSVTTPDRERLARVLARMGATRENTDLITDHTTIRITRLETT
jgi:hypothetical protein